MAPLRRRRAEGPRTRTLKIRFSEEEWRTLETMAQQRHVSVTRLLVDATFADEAQPARAVIVDDRVFELGQALDRIRPSIAHAGAQLVRIGNNVNQLAHVANTAGQVDEAAVLENTAAELGDVLGELRGDLVELREWLIRYPSHP